MFWIASSLIRIHLPSPLFAFNLLRVDGCFSIPCIPGRWCEIRVDLVYTVYPGLIYGSTHRNMCGLPYREQQIESHTIHLKIKGSEQAQVGEEGLWHCGALCENMQQRKHVLLKSGFPDIIASHNCNAKTWRILTTHPINVLHSAPLVTHTVSSCKLFIDLCSWGKKSFGL